jgi:hypothetical protein
MANQNLMPISPMTDSSLKRDDSSSVSLSINYLPSKFSSSVLGAGPRRRRGQVTSLLPKRGGGVDAFRQGVARIPGQNDEDDDGPTSVWLRQDQSRSSKRKLRWNRFKWMLFTANTLVRFQPLQH